jgi:hypothetical protein
MAQPQKPGRRIQMKIEAQASYVTEVQSACREAKASRKPVDLQKALALLESPRFDDLDKPVKLNLQAAYRDAFGAVTGAGTP